MLLSQPGNEPIEESFVSFIDGTNAFAFARTSAAAPPASATASWLTAQNLPTRAATPRVDPVVDNDRFNIARQQAGTRQASWVDVVARPPQQVADGERSLMWQLGRIARDVGDYKIEIKLSVEDDAADASELRRNLFDRAVEIADDLGTGDTSVEHARVKVVGETGPIDLVHDRVVYQARARIELSGTNRSLNERTVFDVLDRVTVQNEARIRRSLGAS